MGVWHGGPDASMTAKSRAHLRARMVDALDSLEQEAQAGTLDAVDLQRRLTTILNRHLGATWPHTTDIAPALNEALEAYDSLHDAEAKKAALETLFRSLAERRGRLRPMSFTTMLFTATL